MVEVSGRCLRPLDLEARMPVCELLQSKSYRMSGISESTCGVGEAAVRDTRCCQGEETRSVLLLQCHLTHTTCMNVPVETCAYMRAYMGA